MSYVYSRIYKGGRLMTKKLIEVNNLKKYFPIKGGVLSKTIGHVRAVDGVSFI